MNLRQIDLDGPWDFCVNTCPNLESVQFDSTIELPAYPQLTIDAPPKEPAYFWYRRQLVVPNARPGHQVIITFGAADWHANVWADDRLLASNRGGYLPFEAVLPTDLHGKPTTLTVRVWDAPLFPTHVVEPPSGDSFDSGWIPRGKQHWYGECSGLWQPVHLCVRPAARIQGIKTDLSSDLKTVHISALGGASESGSLQIQVRPLGGGSTLWESTNSGNLDKGIDIEHHWPEITPWSPSTPSLYQVDATFRQNGITDSQTFVTGFRSICADDEKLWLNGNPLYLRGALDQDYHPTTGFAYPGDAALEKRFGAARAAGLNLLRCHVKLPDPRYLALADRFGLLVWYELPSWGHPALPPDEIPEWLDDEVEAMLQRSAVRDGHYPSLIARSIINEGWGLDIAGSPVDRARLQRWVRSARASDSSRLVIDNSAMTGEAHVDTDLADFHVYANYPNGTSRFRKEVRRLATRPPDLWARGDAAAPRNKPVALTEFGIWGLPDDPSDLHSGLESTRIWTTDASFDQAGFALRFENSCARRAFKTASALCQATREVQAEGLKRQVEILRQTEGLSGFVLTELTDQGWEANGIADFAGEPKPAVESLRSVAAETVIVLAQLPTSVWSGSTVTCNGILSGPRTSGTFDIEWSVNDQPKRQEQVELEYGFEPEQIDAFEFQAPQTDNAGFVSISLSVRGPGLSLEQRAELLVIPESEKTIDGKLRIFLTGASAVNQVSTLANALAEAGCTTLTEPNRVDAIVVAGGGSSAKDLVASGIPALILGDVDDTVFLPSVPRKGTFEPNWCTGFDWIAPDALPNLPVGPLMRAPFETCSASRVIPALDGLEASDVLMGTFRGWGANEAAITAQARYGKGRVLVTTLGLSSSGRSDPLARAILVRLLQYVTSENCQPTSQIR
jgi:hypothetical protein